MNTDVNHKKNSETIIRDSIMNNMKNTGAVIWDTTYGQYCHSDFTRNKPEYKKCKISTTLRKKEYWRISFSVYC